MAEIEVTNEVQLIFVPDGTNRYMIMIGDRRLILSVDEARKLSGVLMILLQQEEKRIQKMQKAQAGA